MKKYLIIALLAAVILSVGVVVAAKPGPRLAVNVIPSKGRATVTIPSQAAEIAPGVFSLGVAVDHDGREVQGYAFVDYKKGFGKPGVDCGNGVCEPGENARKCPADCGDSPEEPDASSCYGFLSKGAKWKAIEPYLVDPANTGGLDGDFVRSNMAFDIDKWEDAAGEAILGDEIAGIVDGADTVSPDNKNEVYFADIESSGAIGVTIVWGIFGGRPSARELVEWDQIYDDVDFDWSATGESGKMDFENIATHELGHSVGLDDLYTVECSEQTMYGYASNGETKKQTLEAGDIRGAQELYK